MKQTFQIEKQTFDEIAEVIHSDTSPVGIDAKKTHIIILKMLSDINDRLDKIEQKMDDLKMIGSSLLMEAISFYTLFGLLPSLPSRDRGAELF